MASPVGSAGTPPRRPEELLGQARARGLVLRRRRRALMTVATAAVGAVVAAGVYLAVPGPSAQHVRTIAPAHTGGGAATTRPGPASTGATTAGTGGTGAGAPVTTGATSANSGPVACASSQLGLSVGAPSGAAGGTYYELTLTNRDTAACILSGYPGVSFLDRSGQQIGQPAQRMGNETVADVRVGPGMSGYVTIRVTDPGVYPCPPVQSSVVRVYPPGQTVALVAPLSAAVCSTGHPAGQVGVVTATSIAG